MLKHRGIMESTAEQGTRIVLTDDGVSRDAHFFRSMLKSYILPLFHSARIEGPFATSKNREGDGPVQSSKSIVLHMSEQPYVLFHLSRDVPFTVQEKALLRDVMENIEIQGATMVRWNHASLCNIIERAIARQISPEHADTILQVLQVYAQWAAETYEGRRITHTVGICCNMKQDDAPSFYELRNNAVLKVLGTAPESILTLDRTGAVTGIETISAKQINYRKNKEVLAPVDMADLALWTNSSSRIAFRLLSNGEVLIFRDKQLAYAKRRSFWRSFPHRSVMYEHFSVPYATEEENAKRAVYLTALDLAFSGKGGCLGILQTPEPKRDAYKLINENMLFTTEHPTNTVRLLSGIAGSLKFHEMSRRVRVGFCSLDGATLIDAQGTILAAGAILRTNGNPLQGGGRSAAAQTLAGYGFGIKISDDGFIEIHRGNSSPLFFA